jgi:hypothetical protein
MNPDAKPGATGYSWSIIEASEQLERHLAAHPAASGRHDHHLAGGVHP